MGIPHEGLPSPHWGLVSFLSVCVSGCKGSWGIDAGAASGWAVSEVEPRFTHSESETEPLWFWSRGTCRPPAPVPASPWGPWSFRNTCQDVLHTWTHRSLILSLDVPTETSPRHCHPALLRTLHSHWLGLSLDRKPLACNVETVFLQKWAEVGAKEGRCWVYDQEIGSRGVGGGIN